MHLPPTLFAFSILAELATAAFNAYALYDHDAVAMALGVSSECLSALNETVECDSVNAARAARGEINDYWSMDNITTLCTSECEDSLSSWLSTVEGRCGNEQIRVNNLVLEPKSFPLKYMAGYDLVCLQDSSENYCFYESQDWDDGTFMQWRPQVCQEDGAPEDCPYPELSNEEITPDQVPVTDIYDRDLYCSECFLLLWRQQLLYPMLSSGSFTDYLVDQFATLEEECSTTMPYTTSDPTLVVGSATSADFRTSDFPPKPKRAVATENNGPHYTTAIPAMPTQPGALQSCGSYYNVVPGDKCTTIAERMGISYDELMSYNVEIDRNCRNLWSNHAICVAPVTKQPAPTNEQCGEDMACEGLVIDLLKDEPVEDEPQKPDNSTVISKDGQCNETVGCVGSGYGDCCSTSRYCGSGPKWCGIGNCISGKCDSEMGGESTDGTCGPLFPGNKTCVGTEFGECCSTSGYCGSTDGHCAPDNCYSGNCLEEEEE